MLKEFKEFAMRGNVVDLAIGVIIGAAFGGIVNSGDRRRHRRPRFLQSLHPSVQVGDLARAAPIPRFC